jgi:hypothetical protein
MLEVRTFYVCSCSHGMYTLWDQSIIAIDKQNMQRHVVMQELLPLILVLTGILIQLLTIVGLRACVGQSKHICDLQHSG